MDTTLAHFAQSGGVGLRARGWVRFARAFALAILVDIWDICGGVWVMI